MLLADIQGIFQGLQGSKIYSAELVNILAQMEHRPWGGLTQHALAKHLEPFEIAPKMMRIGGGKPSRGYEVRWFADAFSRYVRAPAKSDEVVHGEVMKESAETPQKRNKRNGVTKAVQPETIYSAEESGLSQNSNCTLEEVREWLTQKAEKEVTIN
jgi:hypothetical protein